MPCDQGDTWVRVPGNTPLLVSNRLLHELHAVIHVRKRYLQLSDRSVALRRDPKGLSVVDLSELLGSASEDCLQTTCNRIAPAAAELEHHMHQSSRNQLTAPVRYRHQSSSLSVLSARRPSRASRPKTFRRTCPTTAWMDSSPARRM